ncbi:MAG: hypothetical protein Q9217_003131 [Psora testacea]
MAEKERTDQQILAPPAITALQDKGVTERAQLSPSPGVDMRAEREDLKAAAEQSLNVILDLALDGTIRWVSPSWRDVVGTPVEEVKGRLIADLLLSNKDAFAGAVESMKSDDSKSRIIRFTLTMGPHSVLKRDNTKTGESQEVERAQGDNAEEEQLVINLKGQGIMVYDRSSGGESHTMWMLRPSTPPKEVTIDLPELLVESLGVGAEMLADYLTSLADSGTNDPETHPPPLPIMCRICERQITPWWFEKHTEGCTQEYRAESEVSLAQEALIEHRPLIVKVLDAVDPETRQGRPPVAGDTTVPLPAKAEYKGLPIGPANNSSPAIDSGRALSRTASRSRESSISSHGHSRLKSFGVRRPLSKIVTLLVDLCDTALDISMPAIKPTKAEEEGNFRSQSPQSESRISQVLGWQTPNVATSDEEQGLAALIKDTETLASAKVDAVLRHREILEYNERIRVEFNNLVLDCIDAAIKKALSIKAGQLSDSSSESDNEEAETPAVSQTSSIGAYDGPSSIASAQRRSSESSSLGPQHERRQSSVAASSTRSSSPMECPTPRSHVFNAGPLSRSDSVNKGASMLFESDTADSDTGISRSVLIGSRRTESPEVTTARSASSGDRKRRSLKLPNVPSPHRQPSPARISAAPSSPLRIPKPRMPLGLDPTPSLPSPVTSPQLSSTEAHSPSMPAQRHRRQSSAASSLADLNKAPPSPRLNSLSQPPARAVPTSIKDFEIIKPISKGAFGSVYLSKKKSTGDYFAIKVLRKADMVAKNQVTNVKAERAIMMWQGESDFVAKLYWTFSSKDFLFLVMEYLNGGDCASLVKVLGNLPEDWAKKYMAEVVLGVEHLHSRGIVHRDLKPDNLLIDQKGHLKLTDFGLSRMGLVGRQKRALRSPNGPAPDLLKYGPFTRATSMTSSRSASFDLQGNNGSSPQSTPLMTPDLTGSFGQPSYFSLNRDGILGREHSRRKSGYRSDSGNSDSFSTMFRNFSLNDDTSQRGAPIEEENPSDGGESPDLYALRSTISNQNHGQPDTPPQASMLPPPMALFDPEDQNRRFVGTPDYLAPETINGLGQDEMSDWWSLGCILFEFLYGYPPFHGDTPEMVFENILARKIDWPRDEDCPVSQEAKDVMSRLMTIDPKQRLGSNMEEKFSSGGEEIRHHPWFEGINWETLLEDEASFIPAPENPEDTEYFDARGATLQTFTEEMEDQGTSPALTPGADYPDRPHDALSRVRSQVNSMKRGLMPLHIPPHVRDSRSRRLSEPVAADDFGNFTFKNLPVLEKANKDLLQKMRVETAQKQAKTSSTNPPSATSATGPSLDGSPLLPMPLKRTLSANKGIKRPGSPSGLNQPSASPSRTSQPSSPLVSFSTGQNHERRKTSSASSTLSHQSSNSLQPGNYFEPPRLPASQSMSATSAASSPIKPTRHSMNMHISSPEKTTPASTRPQSLYMPASSRARSQTVGSQDGDVPSNRPLSHHKRQSQVFDISPSSSDNEDPRTKALLRVQRRRQSSRRMSQVMFGSGPTFRPLDVLICEDHPVSRLVMERLLEKLRCRTITVANGTEAARYAMSEVQFDIIMMEFKLPQINGADVARMIRDTKSANTQTPIIAVTGYLMELPQSHHFDSLIEKPATMEKITEALQNLCQWKPPHSGYNAPQQRSGSQNPPSGLRQESRRLEDSPNSQASGPFSNIPGLHRRSSRERSIDSSFFGDTDSTNTEDIPLIIGRQSDDWAPNKGLGISEPPPPQDPNHLSSHTSEFIHPGLPHLIHQNSAPPSLGLRTPRKQRSVEAVKAKREDLERNRHECAESGDDEDEELGNVQLRARSPLGKAKNRSSKLGTEMMRTNSSGSVDENSETVQDGSQLNSNPREQRADQIAAAVANISLDEVVTGKAPAKVKHQTPPTGQHEHATITPPELFPTEAKGDTAREIDMDATPRPTGAGPTPLAEKEEEREDDGVDLPIQIPQTLATSSFLR